MATAEALAPRAARGFGGDEILQRAAIVLLIAWLVLTVLLPLWALLSKSFENAQGEWVGLDNYIRYFSAADLWSPRLWQILPACRVPQDGSEGKGRPHLRSCRRIQEVSVPRYSHPAPC